METKRILIALSLLSITGSTFTKDLEVPDAATDRAVENVYMGGRAANDIELNDTKRLLSKVIAQEEAMKELYLDIRDLQPGASERKIGSLIVSLNIARTQLENLSKEGRGLFLQHSGQTDPIMAKYSRLMVSYSLRVHRLVRAMRKKVRGVSRGRATAAAFKQKRRKRSDLRDALISEGIVKRQSKKQVLRRLREDADKLQESANHLYSAAKFLSVASK